MENNNMSIEAIGSVTSANETYEAYLVHQQELDATRRSNENAELDRTRAANDEANAANRAETNPTANQIAENTNPAATNANTTIGNNAISDLATRFEIDTPIEQALHSGL
jgi:hypothetical protein